MMKRTVRCGQAASAARGKRPATKGALTALAAPEVKELFAAQGVTAIGSAADPASAFLQAELEKHARLVKSSGATLD